MTSRFRVGLQPVPETVAIASRLHAANLFPAIYIVVRPREKVKRKAKYFHI
jgi:hypothetical protein